MRLQHSKWIWFEQNYCRCIFKIDNHLNVITKGLTWQMLTSVKVNKIKYINKTSTNLASTGRLVLLVGAVTKANSHPEALASNKSRLVEAFAASSM